MLGVNSSYGLQPPLTVSFYYRCLVVYCVYFLFIWQKGIPMVKPFVFGESWTCSVCGERRPDNDIKVKTHDDSLGNHLPAGTIKLNVRHCADKIECWEIANNISLFKAHAATPKGEGKRRIHTFEIGNSDIKIIDSKIKIVLIIFSIIVVLRILSL